MPPGRSWFALLLLVGPLPPVTSHRTVAGTLVLRNTRWDRVQVDVRMGASTDCPTNASVGVRALPRDQRWIIVSAQVICWRRELVPGNPALGWTTWDQDQVASGASREVQL